jgi:hypothetical protein
VQTPIQSLAVYIKYLMIKVFMDLSFHFIHSHPHHHLNMHPKVSLEGDFKLLQVAYLLRVCLLIDSKLWVLLFRKLMLLAQPFLTVHVELVLLVAPDQEASAFLMQ